MTMTTTQQQDSGLAQRGLILLGGMMALVVVVMLIVLRNRETPATIPAKKDVVCFPVFLPAAPFPATPAWPTLAQLGEQMPSAPGWQIRYNAAVALARRGSPNTPWPLFREMLDEDRQLRNYRTKLKSGKIVPHVEEALIPTRSAMAALVEWHKKQDRAAFATLPTDLQLVYEQVDRLAQNSNTAVRVQADRTRQTFFRAK